MFFQVIRVLVCLCLVAIPSLVFAQTCDDTKSPTTSFDSELEQIEYVRTESVEGLTQWQAGHTAFLGAKVLGVGGGKVGTKLKARYELKDIGNNLYCVYPRHFNALFYASPQIHVASNFARGSCEYSEVLAHEQKHVAELRKFHREYRDDYGKEFKKVVLGLENPQPVNLAQAETIKKETTQKVIEGLEIYTDMISEELGARQQAIDTAAEYQRVVSKCKNWNQKMAR